MLPRPRFESCWLGTAHGHEIDVNTVGVFVRFSWGGPQKGAQAEHGREVEAAKRPLPWGSLPARAPSNRPSLSSPAATPPRPYPALFPNFRGKWPHCPPLGTQVSSLHPFQASTETPPLSPSAVDEGGGGGGCAAGQVPRHRMPGGGRLPTTGRDGPTGVKVPGSGDCIRPPAPG